MWFTMPTGQLPVDEQNAFFIIFVEKLLTGHNCQDVKC